MERDTKGNEVELDLNKILTQCKDLKKQTLRKLKVGASNMNIYLKLRALYKTE